MLDVTFGLLMQVRATRGFCFRSSFYHVGVINDDNRSAWVVGASDIPVTISQPYSELLRVNTPRAGAT